MLPPNLRLGFLILLYAIHVHLVKAAQNQTVDDDDPSIDYEPATSWIESSVNNLDIGGSHKVTSDPNATATFSFTGTAVYFYSPLWPYHVTTAVSLDGAAPITLDLQDHSQPLDVNSGETTASAVVWSADGLDDTEHTLVISVPEGDDAAVVDAITYTVPDGTDLPSTTPTPSSTLSSTTTTTSSSSSKSPTAAVAVASNSNHQGLSIAIAIVCGMFALLVLVAIIYWWRKRKREREEEEAERYAQANDPDMNQLAGDFGSRTRPRTTAMASYSRRPPAPLPPFARRINAVASQGSIGSRKQKGLTTIPEAFNREDRNSVGSSTFRYPFDNHDFPPEASVRLVRQERPRSG